MVSLWLCLLLFQSATGRATSLQSTPAPSLENDLQAAALADKAGDYVTAAKHYQDFLDKVDPAKVKPQAIIEVRTRLATLYFLLHQYQESLLVVTPITKDTTSSIPIPAQAWLVQGLDDLEVNQLPEAIRALRQALEVNPASGTARLALGDALARSGNLAGAIDEFKEQLRRTPQEAEAWYKLGLAYALLSQKVSSEFLRKYPADTVGRQLEAEGLISQGRYSEALRILFPLVQESPSQAGLYTDLGTALLGLGFPQTAEIQFRKELMGNPHAPEALFGLLVTRSLRGDWEGVLDQLEVLAGSNPRELSRFLESPPPAALRQPLQLEQNAMPAQFAHTPAGAAWKNWLQNADVDLSFVETNAKKTCSEAATPPQLEHGMWLSEACYRQLADQLRKHHGTSKAERDKLAEAELRGGNAEAAEALAASALESQPSDGWTIYWLVQSYEALGYGAFRKVSQLSPNSARVHQMMAKYYSDKHETSHAVAEYEAALKLSPEMPDLYLGLGTVYWEAGDWERAEAPLRRALELAPSMLPASYELGDVYVQKRQWELAIQHLRPTLEEQKLRYRACLDLSKAEAALGHTREAVDYLLRVAKQDEDGELHYRLALLYRKTGDSARAEAALAASNQLRQASTQYGQEVLQTMEKERQALDQIEH
jgi:tetratricopeptide (TPR) repeat protein